MNEKKIIKLNHDIAIFRGLNLVETPQFEGYYNKGGVYVSTPDGLSYHKYWNWIMVVVCDLERRGYLIDITTHAVSVSKRTKEGLKEIAFTLIEELKETCKIEAIHESVALACRHWNKEQEQLKLVLNKRARNRYLKKKNNGSN